MLSYGGCSHGYQDEVQLDQLRSELMSLIGSIDKIKSLAAPPREPTTEEELDAVESKLLDALEEVRKRRGSE